jgi:hypothetical protein
MRSVYYRFRFVRLRGGRDAFSADKRRSLAYLPCSSRARQLQYFMVFAIVDRLAFDIPNPAADNEKTLRN